MHNVKLREKMKSLGVKQWEIAEFLGVPECSFSRMMRRELTPDILLSALNAVEVIAANKPGKIVINK